MRLVVTLVLASFVAVGSMLAQSHTPRPQAPAVTPELASGAEGNAHARSQAASGRPQRSRQSPAPVAVAARSLDGYTVLDPIQTWAPSTNPNPKYNFDVFAPGTYAGDVNGDGRDDLVVGTAAARDERTADMGDVTPKTAVFFGGNTTTEPDQFFYANLIPVGDLNGDGFADAASEISVDGADGAAAAEAELFAGSSSGYQPTGVHLDRWMDDVHGYGDVDGDGYQDVLVGEGYVDVDMRLYFGGAGFSVEPKTLIPDGFADMHRYEAVIADVDGMGAAELVVYATAIEDEGRLLVYSFDETRQAVLEQSIDYNHAYAGYGVRLAVLDVDGDGDSELLTTSRHGHDPELVLSHPEGPYFDPDTTHVVRMELPEAVDLAVPVGDLDSDGRDDFVLYDDASDTTYVGYGPDDLRDGLSVDYGMPKPEGAREGRVYGARGGFGDLDGDGLDDALLSFRSEDEVGRGVLYGDAGRTHRTTFVRYPRGHFYGAVLSVTNVGDVDGDGLDDVAMLHEGNQTTVRLYRGGDPVSDTPDLVLHGQPDTLGSRLAQPTGGDLNGDGFTDVVVTYNEGHRVDVYFGGRDMDDVPDHTIRASDILDSSYGLFFSHMIGDVNDDGVDDLLVAGVYRQGTGKLFLFFGGQALGEQPNVTIDYSDQGLTAPYAGMRTVAVGDFNGDGVGDFATSLPFAWPEQVHVFYGDATGTFSEPDFVFNTSGGSTTLGWAGLAAGDFDGDGAPDVAATTREMIYLFRGGERADGNLDEVLRIPPAAVHPWEGYVNENGYVPPEGALHHLPDVDGDGTEELLYVPARAHGSNALLYRRALLDPEPALVLRGPNQSAGLRGLWGGSGGAIGDFNGDGYTEVVLTQMNDDNDAYQSSRIYRYELDASTVAAEGPVQTSEFALSAPYPNPFVSTASVTFSLPATQHVRLALYDVLGRRVALLHTGVLGAGTTHTFEVEGSHLPAGVYVLCAEGERTSTTRRVVRF